MKKSLALLALLAIAMASAEATAQVRDVGAGAILLDDGSGNTLRIVAPPLSSDATLTLPDPSGGGTMVMTTGDQSIAGSKTFTGTTTIGDASSDQLFIPATITNNDAGSILLVKNLFGDVGLNVEQVAGPGTPNPIVHTSTVVSRQTTYPLGADGATFSPHVGTSIIFEANSTNPTSQTLTLFGGYAGQVLHLIGADNGNSYELQSTGNVRLAGGATMTFTDNDVLTLIWNGSNWIEVSRSVNAD